MNRLFARLFPPRGRHARAPREAVSFRMDNTDATWTWLRPDADPAAHTVLLPTMLHTGQRPEPALHLPPTPHAGATEEWSPLGEIGPDDGGSLDPEIRVWEDITRRLGESLDAALADFEHAMAAAQLEFTRGRMAAEARADRRCGGWREFICDRGGCTLCVRDFDEAMQAAGVIALPAKPVDYGTAEWPVVLV